LKRLTFLVIIAAFAVTARAVTHFARGDGVVEGGSFAGAHFEMNIRLPENPTSPNGFAFFDHGMFIPVDIVVPRPGRIAFDGSRVSFSGHGTYNGSMPVTVYVTASDGGRGRPDTFSMFALDATGTTVHSANGNVIEGDITIGVSR
jgi:hypothetical protein